MILFFGMGCGNEGRCMVGGVWDGVRWMGWGDTKCDGRVYDYDDCDSFVMKNGRNTHDFPYYLHVRVLST